MVIFFQIMIALTESVFIMSLNKLFLINIKESLGAWPGGHMAEPRKS